MDKGRSVLIIQTGGTIDKAYPRNVGGYAFEIGAPASKIILERIKPEYIVDYDTVCRKDSQDINDSDRSLMLLSIRKTLHKRVMITHGTDTMIQTAQFLGPRIEDKLVILAGSRLPETMKESDSDFNIGLAIGALQTSDRRGVYVAMNGRVCHWSTASRNMNTGQFMGKL